VPWKERRRPVAVGRSADPAFAGLRLALASRTGFFRSAGLRV